MGLREESTNYDIQPDCELTEEEKLLASLAVLGQRIPGGYQVGMPLHLNRAMALVDELFAEHSLPHKDELLSELREWKAHAEAGLKFSQQCDHLMTLVIRSVDSTVKR
jgi:hypothetical protein